MKYAKWMIALTLVLLPGWASAQLTQSERIVTNVPFGFTVANKIVPEGKWIVQTTSPDGKLLMIRNTDAAMGFFVWASTSDIKKAPAKCALVFTKYGNQRFLSGVEVEGIPAMYRLPESKAEAEIRAKNVPAVEENLLASMN